MREVDPGHGAGARGGKTSKRERGAIATAETALGSATRTRLKEQAERDKAQAIEKIAALQVQLDRRQGAQQPSSMPSCARAKPAAAAEMARAAAAEAARQVARELAPVSVLISRKTQRLYVRQVLSRSWESPVAIQDADNPIGTHVFTAMARAGSDN